MPNDAPSPPASAPAAMTRHPQPRLVVRVLDSGRKQVVGIKRGMVFWVRIPQNHTVGSEQYKTRPWVIVSSEAFLRLNQPVVQAVCLSSSATANGFYRHFRILVPKEEITFYTDCGGQDLDLVDQLALTEQVRTIAQERLVGDPIAQIGAGAIYSIEAGLQYLVFPVIPPPPALPSTLHLGK